MADIRLYRDVYKITNAASNAVYELVDAYDITANVYNDTTNAFIETPSITHALTGRYYAILQPLLYSFINVYRIEWNITYVNGGPSKIVETRFKLQPANIVLDSDSTNYELDIESTLDYEINNNTIEIEIFKHPQ